MQDRIVSLADIRREGGGFANCRKVHASVDELKASIKADGLINPLIVWDSPDGLILVSGHQRLSALVQLYQDTEDPRFDQVPVRVYTGGLDGALALNLSENLHRADLNPADKAEAVQNLARKLGTQEKAAEALGKSQPWVSHQCRIASNLVAVAMEALRTEMISVAQALVLASYVGPDGSPLEEQQFAALDEMLGGKKAPQGKKKRSYRSKKEFEELRVALSSEDVDHELSDAATAELKRLVQWYFMEISTEQLLHPEEESDLSGEAAPVYKERVRS